MEAKVKNVERIKTELHLKDKTANFFKFKYFDEFLNELVESDIEGKDNERWTDMVV